MVLLSTYRRNLLGNLNLLDKLLVSFQRASKFCVALNLLTQIGLDIHQSDQTIFDLEMDLGSLFNGFVEYAFCFDGKDLATVGTSVLARNHQNCISVETVGIHTEQVGWESSSPKRSRECRS